MTASSARRPGLRSRSSKGSGPVSGSGLYFLPVAHSGNQNCSPEEAQAVGGLVRAILAGKRDLGRSRREREADHARRYRHHHALQRAGLRDSATPARRARRHGGQVPGPGSADRHLFDGDIEPCGCAARDGVPLQPQPADLIAQRQRVVCPQRLVSKGRFNGRRVERAGCPWPLQPLTGDADQVVERRIAVANSAPTSRRVT